MEQRQARGSQQSGILAERRKFDPAFADRHRLRPAKRFGANGIEQKIARLHQTAAEHDHVGVEEADEIGDAHREIGDGIAQRGRRVRVAFAGAAHHGFGRIERGAARNGRTGGLCFPTPCLGILGFPDAIHGHPPCSADDAVSPFDQAPTGDDADADSGADGDESYVVAVARGA
jgi:hypothetical protein